MSATCAHRDCKRGAHREGDLCAVHIAAMLAGAENGATAPVLGEVLTTVSLADVEMRSIEWVDRPFLQASAFHLLAGKKGAGKGTWLARQIACATTGDLFGRPVNVLVLSTEDSASIDVKPRIVAAGGDPSRVRLFTQDVLLPRDAVAVLNTAEQIGDVGLVVIDPVANHLRGDSNGDLDVREAISPLNAIADRLEAMILGVRHLKKDVSGGGLASILGSTAWVDVPRVVMVVAADDEDEQVFHVQTVAGNRGPKSSAGREYRIELRDVGLKEPVTFAAELGESTKNVDELLAGGAKHESGTAAARKLILEVLDRVERMESDELDALIAERAGVAAKTVRNIRSTLRGEGLIRSIPERDPAKGNVQKWYVERTNAPDPSRARGERESGPSVSSPHEQTRSLDPGLRAHAHEAGEDDEELERLAALAHEYGA